MKDVEKMIPESIELIKKHIARGTLKVREEYKGYFVNLGVSIRQSGLAPALAFYFKDTGNTKANRALILKILFELLKEIYPQMITRDYGGEDSAPLLQYTLEVIDKPVEYKVLKKRIIQGTIACKLALRLFEQVKGESE